MLRRHQDALKNALDPLTYKQTVTLSRKQFRFWAGIQRLRTKGWQTLIENLPEDMDPKKLSIIEDDDDIVIFHVEKMSRLSD